MRRPLSIPPGKAAVLFVDLQEEHRQDPRYLVEGYDRVLANVGRLQQAARSRAVLLFHCAYIVDTNALRPFHPTMPDGTSAFSDSSDPLTAVCPEVGPAEGETLLIKAEASAFGDNRLARMLREKGVEWLFIAGVWTEACVDASVKDAVRQGFRVALVKDACGSGTAAMHMTAILNLANRLYGGAVIDTETACRLLAGDSVEAWQVEGAVPLRFGFDDAAQVYASL